MLAFLDLDGVLCDFLGGAIKFHNLPIDPKTNTFYGFWRGFGLSDEEFWAELGYKFWVELHPTEECFDILSLVERFFIRENIFICTSPCMTQGCSSGKASWVECMLPSCYSRRLILTGHKEIFAGPDRVLIDDLDNNCTKFKEMGGHVCLVPRLWNSNKYLSHDVMGTIESNLNGILGK